MSPVATARQGAGQGLARRSSLDPKDRRMLLIVLALIVALLVVLAVLTPSQDSSKNPVPGSYLSGDHGAKAAYTLLERSGYDVQRWEQPLGDLAARADGTTVLILAQPYSQEVGDERSIATIVEKGGRVLATGSAGGYMLPGSSLEAMKGLTFADCEAKPEGLEPLAGTGPIWIRPEASWKLARASYHAAYTCAGQAVVVEYDLGKGHVVWWANSTPLENSSILRGQNLELLLNSIGPAAGHHVYWDESLHGDLHTPWDYTVGPVWSLLLFGLIGLGILVVFSFSRRSGPVRELPQSPRSTPIEFLDALGSLYRSAGATATATQIAWDRFRAQAVHLSGQRNLQISARELSEAIVRRFGTVAEGMEEDLIAAEEACFDDHLKPGQALMLVQALSRHEATLREASSARRTVVGKDAAMR